MSLSQDGDRAPYLLPLSTTSNDPYLLLLRTPAYYCRIPLPTTAAYLYLLLLHTTTYYYCIPLPTTAAYRPAYEIAVGNKASGNRPPSILDPFDIFYVSGGWRGFRRCDKAGLSGHYGPSVGLIWSPWDDLVRRPYVPGPRAWLMGGFAIDDVGRESRWHHMGVGES